jgi:carboxymethylenebutenolidase
MGEHIEFPSNGQRDQGYLSTPAPGSGPGVIVVQEWWGLVPHIEDVCDRFAAEGLVALAPDLYHGTKVAPSEPDEAAKQMMALNLPTVARDLSGAVDEVVRRSGRAKVGVVGFCMGGGLALMLATERPDAVSACVPFYGVVPWPAAKPDYSRMEASVLGHYAALDSFTPPETVRAFESELRSLGKSAELHVYDGCEHAFFNDTRKDVYNASASSAAWDRTLAFLRENLS